MALLIRLEVTNHASVVTNAEQLIHPHLCVLSRIDAVIRLPVITPADRRATDVARIDVFADELDRSIAHQELTTTFVLTAEAIGASLGARV